MEYALIKFLHLGALIFWLGPAFGAWLVVKYIERQDDAHQHTLNYAHRALIYLILVEHVALVVLLASGYFMASKFGWFDAAWLQQKLWIVVGVVVPLEIADIILANWFVHRATNKQLSGLEMNKFELDSVKFYHGAFTKLAIVLIPASVTLIMFLAISKQALL